MLVFDTQKGRNVYDDHEIEYNYHGYLNLLA